MHRDEMIPHTLRTRLQRANLGNIKTPAPCQAKWLKEKSTRNELIGACAQKFTLSTVVNAPPS